jgi:chromate transporter
MRPGDSSAQPSLAEIGREWGRIGCTGFGGPPVHISLLRALCVQRHRWMSEDEFEHAIAACNLLPGPVSTQLAIFCAWRITGPLGALIGGVAFILPGLALILLLSIVFLAASPPAWIRGAGAGAGAAVAAVAARAGTSLLPASWRRSSARLRWILYATAGAVSAATIGPWLVLVLFASGAFEMAWRPVGEGGAGSGSAYAWTLVAVAGATTGGALALAWVAFKVGALSYGGGFVIVPLMQAEAVNHYHWMSAGQFVTAVALGQVTPGPVLLTVSVVGYAAAGIGGGLMAGAIAFAPSFSFVLLGAPWFDRLRGNRHALAFLDGAGPAAIGAIVGSSVPLAAALGTTWQYLVLALAALALLALRQSIVATLLAAGAAGALAALAGAAIPH